MFFLSVLREQTIVIYLTSFILFDRCWFFVPNICIIPLKNVNKPQVFYTTDLIHSRFLGSTDILINSINQKLKYLTLYTSVLLDMVVFQLVS